jgi:hypothetical protein
MASLELSIFAIPPRVRIPTQSGHRFRFDVGRHSDLKPATIPK